MAVSLLAVSKYLTVGLTLLAGAAVLEAALIPGLVVGGAVVLAPRYVPKLRRRLQPLFESTVRRPRANPQAVPNRAAEAPPFAVPARAWVGQAVAKTITFRIIVTTLDFTTNYLVIGELATAAGLSTFNLIAGPLFYFAHEAVWNHFGPTEAGGDIRVSLPGFGNRESPEGGAITISRALAKTITFRTIATVMDFTTNYVVVGDAVSAAGLSAFAFVVGPFVYLGHEKIWDYYGTPNQDASEPPGSRKLLPAPA